MENSNTFLFKLNSYLKYIYTINVYIVNKSFTRNLFFHLDTI